MSGRNYGISVDATNPIQTQHLGSACGHSLYSKKDDCSKEPQARAKASSLPSSRFVNRTQRYIHEAKPPFRFPPFSDFLTPTIRDRAEVPRRIINPARALSFSPPFIADYALISCARAKDSTSFLLAAAEEDFLLPLTPCVFVEIREESRSAVVVICRQLAR